MKIQTTLFGEMDINKTDIIHFEEGIPAFEKEKQFVIIPMEEKGPFYYMQSADNPELCLIIANPFIFFPDYEIDMKDEELAKLGTDAGENLAVYTIVTIPDEVKLITANLLAPIVINSESRKGIQFIPEKSKYGTRHFIFNQEEVQKSAAEGR